MDILVVGGGGREHAIVMKLAESPKVGKLYCTPGNGGISRYAECFDVAATDIEGVVALAKKLKVDMVAVAPDDPLVLSACVINERSVYLTLVVHTKHLDTLFVFRTYAHP